MTAPPLFDLLAQIVYGVVWFAIGWAYHGMHRRNQREDWERYLRGDDE